MSPYDKGVNPPTSLLNCATGTTSPALNFVTAMLAIIAALSALTFQSFGITEQFSILTELGPKLSPNASIILPNSTDFAAATLRWTEYQAPKFSTVVKVANEEDVQETILYANKHDIPFLATNGKHGDYATLKQLHNGIQIWHKNFDYVKISTDGTYATIGGGAKVKQVVDQLSAANKRAVTGLCDCVGVGGSTLGGGHGWLQGQYGLAADSIIEARVILANASAITVSNSSHPDLFWALKGAGHNFGIVTEWKHKVYDFDASKQWAFETLVFTQDQLEEVFSSANVLSKTQVSKTVHMALINIVPDINPVKPVINWLVFHDGPLSSLQAQTSILHNLKPLSSTSGYTPYNTMSRFFGSSENDPACQPGFTLRRYPIDLKSYNSTAIRQAYNLFAKKMAEVPALNNSLLAVEQYSVQAVQAVASESTAFPHRAEKFLMSPFIVYAPDTSLDEIAHTLGQDIRNMLLEGTGSSKLNAYVNYAHGDEPLEAIYGWEPWRLEKLRRLKREYDPMGRFSFYAPFS